MNILWMALISLVGWGGNGSSTIGTARIPIPGAQGLYIAQPSQNIEVSNGIIRDKRSNQELLKIEHITQEELARYTRHMRKARVGKILGWRSLSTKFKGYRPSWIVCSPKDECLRFRPISPSDQPAQMVVNDLTY